ncbi:WD40 repeat domain-containing protein [Agaribacter flavus]|uniref:WD40 repeat domain-containing protein n=1 Tax=Agaribacter flavus TaxID=1902781 RepID=A0ABV7FR77_9ALTE
MKSLLKIALCTWGVIALSACTVPDSSPTKRTLLSESGVYAADIAHDASVAIVSSVNGAVEVWDLQTGDKKYTWRHQGEGLNLVDNVKLSPDNSVAVSSDDETFALWDMDSGEVLGFWRIDESNIRDIAVSNGGNGIVVGRANGKVLFFEPYTGRRLEFIGHEEKINAVDISANGKYALTGGNDYRAYLWSTDTGQIEHVFTHPHRVTQVVLDQGARYVFTSDSQDDAQIWDAQTGQAVSQLRFIERQIIFTAAQFSGDGKHLLTGSPAKRLMLWDVQSGELRTEWRVKANSGPAPQSAVVYAVGFEQSKPLSISSSGNLAHWEIQQ